jgi:hypothetical protein
LLQSEISIVQKLNAKTEEQIKKVFTDDEIKYLYLIKNAYRQEYLEHVLNDESQSVSHRLFALMYLKTYFAVETDYSGILRDFSEKLKEEIGRAGSFEKNLPINNVFELRAYLFGIHLIMTSTLDAAQVNSSHYYKKMTEALTVWEVMSDNGAKPYTVLANSSFLFSSKEGGALSASTLVHEIGHNYLRAQGFYADSIVSKTFHEFYAMIISFLLGSILGVSTVDNIRRKYLDPHSLEYYQKYEDIMSGKEIQEHEAAEAFIINHLIRNLFHIRGAFNELLIAKTIVNFVKANFLSKSSQKAGSQKGMFEKFIDDYAKTAANAGISDEETIRRSLLQRAANEESQEGVSPVSDGIAKDAFQEAINAANPSKPINVSEHITVKLVKSQEEAAALENDDLNISKTLVIVSDELLAADLSRQEFKTAVVSEESVLKEKPAASEGWSKIKVALTAQDSKVNVYVKKENGTLKFGFYSKAEKLDLDLVKEELQNVVAEGVIDEAFEGISQIIITNEFSMKKIESMMKNKFTASDSTPVADIELNLRGRGVISNFENFCIKQRRSKGIGIFVIEEGQAQESAIYSVRKEGIKVVVVKKLGEDYENIKYDGIRLEAQDIAEIYKAQVLLERLQDLQSRHKGARISVKFNDKLLKEFMENKINIWKKYGIIPIVSSGNEYKRFGKAEIEFVKEATKLEIQSYLSDDNAIALCILDESELDGALKEEVNQAKTEKQKCNKTYNAALRSKFDYTAKSVDGLLGNGEKGKSLITKNAAQVDNLKEEIEKIDKENLSYDSKEYLEYLIGKESYAEALVFIRAVAMNTLRREIIETLKENKIEIDMEGFKKLDGGDYQKAMLTLALQLKMAGKDIKELIKGDIESGDMSAADFFEILRSQIRKETGNIIRENEDEVNELKEKEEEAAQDLFNQFNVIMQDELRELKASAGVKISMTAVRSILQAA